MLGAFAGSIRQFSFFPLLSFLICLILFYFLICPFSVLFSSHSFLLFCNFSFFSLCISLFLSMFSFPQFFCCVFSYTFFSLLRFHFAFPHIPSRLWCCFSFADILHFHTLCISFFCFIVFLLAFLLSHFLLHTSRLQFTFLPSSYLAQICLLSP